MNHDWEFINQDTPDNNTLSLAFTIQPGYEVMFYFKSYKLAAICFAINTNKREPQMPHGVKDPNSTSSWLDYDENTKTKREYKNEYVLDYLTPIIR